MTDGIENRFFLHAFLLGKLKLRRDAKRAIGLVPVESASYTYSKYVETFDGDHVAISEKGFLYKGEPVWKKVFTRVLENIRVFEAASAHNKDFPQIISKE